MVAYAVLDYKAWNLLFACWDCLFYFKRNKHPVGLEYNMVLLK